MSALGRRAEAILENMTQFLIPAGMTTKERAALALKAGVSPETLRTALRRQTMNANTLVRLCLARGIAKESIESLRQTELSQLSKSEGSWLQLGHKLSDLERVEFCKLVETIRATWVITKP
jgi:lambda repressor-like predicted transcriptional regulator